MELEKDFVDSLYSWERVWVLSVLLGLASFVPEFSFFEIIVLSSIVTADDSLECFDLLTRWKRRLQKNAAGRKVFVVYFTAILDI